MDTRASQNMVVHNSTPRLKMSGELRGMTGASVPTARAGPMPAPPTPIEVGKPSLVPNDG